MILTNRTCSNCGQWKEHYGELDGFVVAMCNADGKLKKGSDKCSKWRKIKFREAYNPATDEMIQIRDWR